MSHSRPLLRFGFIATLALAASCASGSAPSAGGTSARPTNTNVLTAAEIEAAGAQDGTVYDAIRRLRPRFLQYHGTSGSDQSAGQLLVSIDGGALDDISALRSIPARQVLEVRYLSAADAAQQFGTSANSSPVILLRQR